MNLEPLVPLNTLSLSGLHSSCFCGTSHPRKCPFQALQVQPPPYSSPPKPGEDCFKGVSHSRFLLSNPTAAWCGCSVLLSCVQHACLGASLAPSCLLRSTLEDDLEQPFQRELITSYPLLNINTPHKRKHVSKTQANSSVLACLKCSQTQHAPVDLAPGTGRLPWPREDHAHCPRAYICQHTPSTVLRAPLKCPPPPQHFWHQLAHPYLIQQTCFCTYVLEACFLMCS